MGLVRIVLTVLVVMFIFLAIYKKLNTATTLLVSGLLILFLYILITGTTLVVDITTGNNYLDIFQVMKYAFVKQLSSTGILIMSVMGFVSYMNHIKASKMLALLVAKPLINFKRPNVILVFSIFMATGFRLFIPSRSGLSLLLMATIYPILLMTGIKKITAASTVVMGCAFDLGPACPITGWAMMQRGFSEKATIMQFFVNYQIPMTLVAMTISCVIFIILIKEFDSLDQVETRAVKVADPKSLEIPYFYAVLPTIPIFILLISDLFFKHIRMDVTLANFIGFFMAFIINIIVSKQRFVKKFNESRIFWQGMATSFSDIVVLITASSVFSTALDYIGGTYEFIEILTNLPNGGNLVIIGSAIISFFTGTITGSGLASIYMVAPLLPPAAQVTGMNSLTMLAPIIAAAGMGSTASPIGAAIIIAANISEVRVWSILKRTAMPALGGTIAAVLYGIYFL